MIVVGWKNSDAALGDEVKERLARLSVAPVTSSEIWRDKVN